MRECFEEFFGYKKLLFINADYSEVSFCSELSGCNLFARCLRRMWSARACSHLTDSINGRPNWGKA